MHVIAKYPPSVISFQLLNLLFFIQKTFVNALVFPSSYQKHYQEHSMLSKPGYFNLRYHIVILPLLALLLPHQELKNIIN